MNRSEIKSKAKEMIKSNLWHIWKVYLVTFAIGLVIGFVEGLFAEVPIISFLISIASVIITAALSVGACYYILKFVRDEKIGISDFLEFAKKHWSISLLAILLAGLCIFGGTLLLIIPGIIIEIGLFFVTYVISDNPELSAVEVIKKSWSLTNGYKADIFVFWLSFLGWMLLAPFTFGLLYIWLVPYVTIASTLLYEELRKKQNNNN